MDNNTKERPNAIYMNDCKSYEKIETKMSGEEESRVGNRSNLMNATVEECESDFGAG